MYNIEKLTEQLEIFSDILIQASIECNKANERNPEQHSYISAEGLTATLQRIIDKSKE